MPTTLRPHAETHLAPKRIERRLECIDSDMVEECGEPFLLLQPCGLPYAVQRLGHASPVLCPVRALLALVPLGPRPWLSRLRHRSPGFVRQLRSYYAGVRLLWIVHQRLRLLAFPPRTRLLSEHLADRESSPGSRTRSFCTCQGLRPRRNDWALAISHPFVLPSAQLTASALGKTFFRGSMAGLCTPLPTLRRHPHGCLRTARGRCGSLFLHRSGLPPPTPCRSPGAPTVMLVNGASLVLSDMDRGEPLREWHRAPRRNPALDLHLRTCA